MTATPEAALDPMEVFYQDLERKSMGALWRGGHQQGGRPTEPKAPYDPGHWKWSDISGFVKRAGELVQPGADAQRRVITLNNQSAPGHSATHMLSGNVQMVLPGEVAPSHRHTNAAIRFIMQGEGAVTIVDGEPVAMRPGDLVLTPGWTYHGHVSQASGPVLWMDSLDGPLVVQMLKLARYQQYPDELEPATKPEGDSFDRYGSGHLRPLWDKSSGPVSPQLLYPWDQTEKALQRLAKVDASPFDDVAFEYTNPTNGGHVLPTIGCNIQMIRAGVHTQAHRHSNCSVFHVYRGEGYSVVDGVKIEWHEGDFFALPPWCWHEHANTSAVDAVLFSTTDLPVIESLNLLEEHAYTENGGHQTVTATFEERYG
jgi:gentisate 1,2-dioxygenase